MNKTYLELASEAVTAMINKGYLRIPVEGKTTATEYNYIATRTIGWAILEMYRELKDVPVKAARQPRKKPMQVKANVKVVK